MKQFVLISVMLATFAVPAAVRRAMDAPGYPDLLKRFVICTAIYVLLMLYVYPRL